jgi:YolD-like protein
VIKVAVSKLSKGHNLRWESSRMMLPEHVEAFLQQKKEKLKVPKPIIDEQAFMEIGRIVMASLRQELDIQITIWKDGHIINFYGTVNRVDYQMKYILLEQEDEEFVHILINDIIGAEKL